MIFLEFSNSNKPSPGQWLILKGCSVSFFDVRCFKRAFDGESCGSSEQLDKEVLIQPMANLYYTLGDYILRRIRFKLYFFHGTLEISRTCCGFYSWGRQCFPGTNSSPLMHILAFHP